MGADGRRQHLLTWFFSAARTPSCTRGAGSIRQSCPPAEGAEGLHREGGGVLGRRREQQIEGALAHTGTHMHTCTHTCHSVQGLTEVAARPVYARPVVSSSSPVFARVLPLALPSSPADDTTHAQ